MSKLLIQIFAIVAALQLIVAAVIFAHSQQPAARAVLGMGLGLYLFWIVLAGLLTFRFRNTLSGAVRAIPIPWPIKFVLFCTVLAMLEEAITVSLTNTAPLWGVTAAQAHITASANYWDVVLTSSVVLFVPMFCIWAVLLAHYNFSAEAVFLTWGAVGIAMETIASGPAHLLESGMWMFVYGLMIYLPVRAIPALPARRPLRWWHYPLAFAAVLLGIIPGGLLATLMRHLRLPAPF